MTESIRADRLATEEVKIDTKWPAGFITSAVAENKRNKTALFKTFYNSFLDDDTVTAILSSKGALNIEDTEYTNPDSAMALSTYVLSSLWKDNISKRDAMKFKLVVDTKTTTIYSLRKSTSIFSDLSDKVLYDDSLHCSQLFMNAHVQGIFDKMQIYAMNPLSRVSMTNENINRLAASIAMNKMDVVKTLNMSCLRKSYQMVGFAGFDPDFAIAALVRSAYSQRSTEMTKNIANKQITKISNSGVSINENRLLTILSHMQGFSNTSLNIETLYQKIQNGQRAVVGGILPQYQPSTVITTFSRGGNNNARGGE